MFSERFPIFFYLFDVFGSVPGFSGGIEFLVFVGAEFDRWRNLRKTHLKSAQTLNQPGSLRKVSLGVPSGDGGIVPV